MSTNMRMASLFSRFLYFVICLTGFTGKTLLLSNVKSSMKGDLSGSFFCAVPLRQNLRLFSQLADRKSRRAVS
jgi:hypothetical protein